MSNNRFDGLMLRTLNERSELQRFRDGKSDEELQSYVEKYDGLWRSFFEQEMRKDVPRHPWKVLKMARKKYAEEKNDGDWPNLKKRHALRVVKDEYVEKWESYKENFNKG